MSGIPKRTVLTLTVALLLVSAIRFALRPESWVSDPESQRNSIINTYLFVKNNPGSNFEILDEGFRELRKNSSPVVLEALALIFAVENQEAMVQELLNAIGEDRKTDILRFALGYPKTLPDGWESMLRDDWVDHKISMMVYEIQKDEQGAARALIHLRHHEKQIRRQASIAQTNLLMSSVGAGLLISMFISSRHWKRYQKKFFKLNPLPLPLTVLYRYVAFLLVGSLAIELIFINLNIGKIWATEVLVTLLQIGWAYWLIKNQIFHADNDAIAEVLNIAGLKMKIGYLFQILGGLTMILFLENIADLFGKGVNWPTGYVDSAYFYETYFKYPVGGVAFVVMACIVAPIFEEIIFRGLIFRSLLAHTKPWPALWGSALIYGLFHPFGLWPIATLIGFGLAVIYYRTNNILINIGAHALRNLLLILITYLSI